MCAQLDYEISALNTATTSVATTTTTTENCICCHQLRATSTSYIKSSSLTCSEINTTSQTSTKNAFRHNIWHLLVILTTVLVLLDHCLLGACAAPQSCVLCDINDLQANVEHAPSTNYQEYLFEHQVTRQDAINALKMLNESFYEGPSPELSCKSVSCTKTVMKYCLSPQFINDHCWCELGHTEEGLPYIPHICYVGEKTYSASVGSCFFYEEVKECCCAPALAKQWRHISEASDTKNIPNVLLSILLLLLAGLRRDGF